jgi:glycosidase
MGTKMSGRSVSSWRKWVLGLLFATAAAAQTAAPPSPEWLKSGVIYEINPRTFSASGDFRGIELRLPDLRKLGVTILWIMPIHPPGKLQSKGSLGSPYAVRDYYAIDANYGQPADFRSLVNAAHRDGFKVIIDIVANHTAWDSVLMQHPEFYKHDAAGNIIPPVADWSDVAALNYDNPKLREYMIRMLAYWLREFDLDGFRCDVAFQVPVSFWNEARAALEKIKPDIMMLAEAHSPELLEKAFNLDYSWPLHSDLTDVFEFGKPASILPAEWAEERRIYPAGSLHMRFSDNHDEKRAIARFGERGALAASALMFTMDGVPLVYNGMEVGDTTESGAPALFERLPVFWQIVERRPEFPKFYEQIIALRRMHPALQQGATTWLKNSEPDRILSYARAAASDEFVVTINCSNRPFHGRVEAASDGPWEDVTPGAKAAVVKLPEVELAAWGFQVLRATAKEPSVRR